jgi:hypothetical protein
VLFSVHAIEASKSPCNVFGADSYECTRPLSAIHDFDLRDAPGDILSIAEIDNNKQYKWDVTAMAHRNLIRKSAESKQKR